MLTLNLRRGVALFVLGLSVPLLTYTALMTAATRASAAPNEVPIMNTETAHIKHSESGYNITKLDDKAISRLAEKLTDEQKRVILNDGTEKPFCGTLLDNKKEGVYICALCELPLFSSSSKFNSGTGWPSFFQPFDKDHVSTHEDSSYGMVRTEINCARCGGHLGHVFEDGPEPTGLRFCVNSESLGFIEDGDELPKGAQPVKTETAYFAGGCFWGVEDRFQKQPGVISAVSGFQGGDDSHEPSYREVCTGVTGHAESVRIVYDPAVISYEDLLTWFFRIHDPTQGNRQGPDIGTQYRSAIFTTSDAQQKAAERFLKDQQKSGRWSKKKITTELRDAEGAKFYKAEEYHQDYYARNGGTCYTPIYDD